jgi:hypothetical protein
MYRAPSVDDDDSFDDSFDDSLDVDSFDMDSSSERTGDAGREGGLGEGGGRGRRGGGGGSAVSFALVAVGYCGGTSSWSCSGG